MDPGRDIDTERTQEPARRCAQGSAAARDQLFAAVYEDLRQRAHRLLRQSEGATLSTHAHTLALAQERVEQADLAFGKNDPRVAPALVLLAGQDDVEVLAEAFQKVRQQIDAARAQGSAAPDASQ